MCAKAGSVLNEKYKKINGATLSSSIKKNILLALKFSVAFGLIFYLIQSGDLDFKIFLQIKAPLYFALCIVILCINVLVMNYRWSLLLWDKGFKVTFKETLNLTLMGLFFNFTLPSSVGGDAVKAYYLAKNSQSKKILTFSSVLVDRVLGLFVMVGVGWLALVFNFDMVKQNKDLLRVFYAAGIFFSCMSIGLVAIFSRTINNSSWFKKLLSLVPRTFEDLYQALNSFGQSKKTILKTIFISIVAQMLSISFFICFALSIGAQLPLGVFFFAVPVGFIIMSVPVSPGGLGIGQLAFLTLFQLYLGDKSQVGQLGITSFQVLLFLLGLIGAYRYARGPKGQVNQEVVK